MTDLDAQGLYARLRDAVAPWATGGAHLVGIVSGGAWLAERLHAELGLAGSCGVLSSTLHRDDFAARGLAPSTTTTRLPFAIEGAHLVLIDDVLHTGRTVRAALNELYDFGRPASVRLAVLADRGGRELPMAATFAATTLAVPAGQRLVLARAADGQLVFTQQGG